MLQTDIFNGKQFSASQGFYVGDIFDRTTTTQTSTQVIDGSGNWVGNALSDTKLSSNVALKNINNLFTARQRIESTATAAASITSSTNTLELYSQNTGDGADYISMLFHHGSQSWGAIRYNNLGFHITDGDDLDYRNIYAKSFKTDGGTSSQFVKGDGSLDSNTYLTSYTETDTLDTVMARGNTSAYDLRIVKDEPWFTLDSSNSGSNTVEQAAGISLGESGTKGAAAVHITYTGDGKGWLGMGAVTDAVPAYKALTMVYNSQKVGIGGDYSGSYNVNINGTTNFTSTINVVSSATFAGDIYANSGNIRSTVSEIDFLTDGGAALPIRTASVLASNNYSDSSKVPTNGIYSLGGIRTDKYLYAEGNGTFTSGIDSATNAGVVINAGDYIYAQLSGNYLRKLIGINGSSLEVGHPGTSLISEIVLKPGTSNIIKGEGRFQSDYDLDVSSYGAFHVERTLGSSRTTSNRGFADATIWNGNTSSLGYAGVDIRTNMNNGTYDHITSFQSRPSFDTTTIIDVEGVSAYADYVHDSTITNFTCFSADKPFTFDNSTITNFYGLKAAAGTGINGASITNFYGMYIGDGTVDATNKYAIFSDDSSVDVRVDGEIWAGTFRAQGEIYSPNTSTKFRVGGETSSLYLEMNAIGSIATFNDMNLKVDKEVESKNQKTTQPTADNEFNGEIVYFGTSGTFAAGDVVTLNTSGQWVKADASAEATAYGLMGVALGTSASSNGILINGYARISAFSGFTTGVPLFLSETAGDVTSTAPTATNTIVRVLGYKVDTNTVFFKPDNSWIKNL